MTFKGTNNSYLLANLGGEYLASIRHMRILMNNMDINRQRVVCDKYNKISR